VASSKERARRLARAKMERQMARRATRARRNRMIQAGIVAGAVVVLLVLGSLWVGGVFSSKPAKKATAASACTWKKADTAANTNLKDVGTPPTDGIPKNGSEVMTIKTGIGTITAALDLSKAPCTAASFKYLGSKNFFNGSRCHRLLDKGDYVLQCGDPSYTGSGGPGYTFADEYMPTSAGASAGTSAPSTVTYPAGALAMANSGANTNGSQFFIVYRDSPFPPNYTVFGQITAGLDLVQQVGDAGDDGAFASDAGGGHPKKEVKIESLTVGDVNPASAPPAAPASPSAATTPATHNSASSAS
jgi:peptidyl-prolyl cis-trans isomerase B (cyclophilin B)